MTDSATHQLLRSTRRSAAHLETRDGYTPDDPDWIDWREGRRFDPVERWRDWFDLNHFDGDGNWIGEERRDDPGLAGRIAAAFEMVWERAVDHAAYRPA